MISTFLTLKFTPQLSMSMFFVNCPSILVLVFESQMSHCCKLCVVAFLVVICPKIDTHIIIRHTHILGILNERFGQRKQCFKSRLKQRKVLDSLDPFSVNTRNKHFKDRHKTNPLIQIKSPSVIHFELLSILFCCRLSKRNL